MTWDSSAGPKACVFGFDGLGRSMSAGPLRHVPCRGLSVAQALRPGCNSLLQVIRNSRSGQGAASNVGWPHALVATSGPWEGRRSYKSAINGNWPETQSPDLGGCSSTRLVTTTETYLAIRRGYRVFNRPMAPSPCRLRTLPPACPPRPARPFARRLPWHRSTRPPATDEYRAG